MAEKSPFIAGNWKMNGSLTAVERYAGELKDLVRGVVDQAEIIVCPPATLLAPMAYSFARSGIQVGAQSCHHTPEGAHTGDLTAVMVSEVGARYVICGHSERRASHGETDEMVKSQATLVHEAEIKAIICIGETEEEYDAGQSEAVVAAQLKASLPDTATSENTVIAYEPIWAIGTGRTPSTEEIFRMHNLIGEGLKAALGSKELPRVVYGGSVKPDNAAAILGLVNVDGALVGGASLKAEDFAAIARAAIA